MTDLHVLIRLHKHELDEKRRALADLYEEMAQVTQARQALEDAFLREKKAVEATGDVHFTLAGYTKQVAQKRDVFDAEEAAIEEKIDAAKESLMETFSELKKYEMTQEERDRLEEEERRVRDGLDMDAIGLEGFRRKSSED